MEARGRLDGNDEPVTKVTTGPMALMHQVSLAVANSATGLERLGLRSWNPSKATRARLWTRQYHMNLFPCLAPVGISAQDFNTNAMIEVFSSLDDLAPLPAAAIFITSCSLRQQWIMKRMWTALMKIQLGTILFSLMKRS